MYKLLELSKATIRKCSPVSLRNLRENECLSTAEKTCLLCKHLNITSQVHIRNSSSITKANLNKPKKTKKKWAVGKKYTDILMIKENSSALRKANIEKLTSEDLRLLATTSFNLNELYKLKQIEHQIIPNSHSYNSLTILDSPLELANDQNSCDKDNQDLVKVCQIVTQNDTEFLEDNVTITKLGFNEKEYEALCNETENEIDLEHIKIVNTFHPAEVEEDAQETADTSEIKVEQKPKISENEYARRQAVASKTLAAYIEICNHQKNPQRGLAALHFHRSRVKRYKNKFQPIKNTAVYSTLLKGFADKGDYQKLKEVLSLMEEVPVEPNLQCYIGILLCLSKINYQNHYLKDIRIYCKAALQNGYSFDRILNEGVFLNNERESILKVMQLYDPDYTPVYREPNIWYNNHMLNHLNHEDQIGVKFKRIADSGGYFKPETLRDAVEKQVKLEEHGYVTIQSIESKGKPTEEVIHCRKALESHFKLWEETAYSAFHRDLATLTAHRSPLNLEPYLRSIPVKDIMVIILDEAKKLATGSETYSPTLNMLYRDMGSKVYARYKILMKQKAGVLDKVLNIHTKYCEDYATCREKSDDLPKSEILVNSRTKWQWMEYNLGNTGPTLKIDHQPWQLGVLTSIGKFLYHILMHDLRIDVNSLRQNSKHKNFLPAFYTIFRTQSRISKEEIKPHPVLAKLFRASQPETLTFPTYEIPMLCPPVPWTSIYNGGYLISPCEVIRLPAQASVQKQRLAETDPVNLYPSLDALNQLASVPWKVNTKVLDTILDVFRNGGSAKLDVPEPPSSLPPPPAFNPDMDKIERYRLFKLKLQHRRKKAEMYSLWCDCLYRLSLANHYRDDTFWLPHNMDFRGRVYPVPPHLNHLGSDLARSMLVFAEPRPLGPKGLDWLKIHLINLTGLKKRDSLDDRLKLANELMPKILDSADKPLNGERWWTESDEPWQTLACCIEIANVVRSDVPPEKYLSHFPVHQDGSCNGLQHYAALGRDSAGAHSVNLTPCEVPQDVYSAVVALVEQQRQKDAENGIEIAKTLEGFVKRKVIKQTIMTTVYGVTRFGARLQIARQLKDIDSFPRDAVWQGSSYLTGRTFDSLKTMFTSTKLIQDWFTECAKLISGVGLHQVEWVTPLGLPVVQPYFKYKKSASMGYDCYPTDQFEKPNTMKQKNAFPPNYIHSLDSCHMMLTSLHCERAAITFVSVHDCYWTHPSTIHIMSKICREQFVKLHSEPLLENLSVFMYERYSYDDTEFIGDGSAVDLSKKKLNNVLRKLPKTGDFDIRKVLDSTYFFS